MAVLAFPDGMLGEAVPVAVGVPDADEEVLACGFHVFLRVVWSAAEVGWLFADLLE